MIVFISVIATGTAAGVAIVAVAIVGRYFTQECKQVIQIYRFIALLMCHIAIDICIQFVVDLMCNFRQRFNFFSTNAILCEIMNKIH